MGPATTVSEDGRHDGLESAGVTSEGVTGRREEGGSTGRQGLGRRVRQWLQPEEFRIEPPAGPSPEYHDLRERVDELQTRIDALDAARASADRDAQARADHGVEDGVVVGIAMGLWRARKRLARLAETDGAGARSLGHQLRPSWEALERMDVQINDHDGELFDSGLPLEALAIQPEPGLTHEKILETVAPTVLRSGRRVQMGQVIVGRPERTSS